MTMTMETRDQEVAREQAERDFEGGEIRAGCILMAAEEARKFFGEETEDL